MSSETEIEKAISLLTDARTDLESKKSILDDSETTLNNKKKELDTAILNFTAKENEYNKKQSDKVQKEIDKQRYLDELELIYKNSDEYIAEGQYPSINDYLTYLRIEDDAARTTYFNETLVVNYNLTIEESTFKFVSTTNDFINTKDHYDNAASTISTLENEIELIYSSLTDSTVVDGVLKNKNEAQTSYDAQLAIYNEKYEEYIQAQETFNLRNEEYTILNEKYENDTTTFPEYPGVNEYDPYSNYYKMENGYTEQYRADENYNTETSYSQNFDGSSKVERIFIDSRNRISTSKSSTNFMFELKNKRKLKYVNKITLLNHNINFNYQSLINEHNNKFRLYSSAFILGEKNVKKENFLLNHIDGHLTNYELCYKELTLPVANYSLDSLAKNLQGFIRANTNKFEAVKYNNEVNRFEFLNIPNLDINGVKFCNHISNDDYIVKDTFLNKFKTYIYENNSINTEKKYKFTKDDTYASDNVQIFKELHKIFTDKDVINYTYSKDVSLDNTLLTKELTDVQFNKLNSNLVITENKFYKLLFNLLKRFLQVDSHKTLFITTPIDGDENTANVEINLSKLYTMLKNNEYCLTSYIDKNILEKNSDNKFYYFFKFNNKISIDEITETDRAILNRLENSLANVIGLHPDKLYSGSNNYNFISNKPLSLEKDPYIYLSINNYNNYDIFNFDPTTNVDDNSEKNKAVSFIINDKDFDKDNILPSITFKDGIHIDKFNVRLLDFYGSIVNLGNKDFYIEIEVESGIINNY